MTHEVVKSSAIEGETLNPDEVCSFIERRFGIDVVGLFLANHDVEGIVEMMLDGPQRYYKLLTEERLFDRHSALFPSGRSGMSRITGPLSVWAMQVITGQIGREKVHFEAPSVDPLDREMSSFLSWLNSEQKIDPIIIKIQQIQERKS